MKYFADAPPAPTDQRASGKRRRKDSESMEGADQEMTVFHQVTKKE